jgi:predicted amidohydrolase
VIGVNRCGQDPRGLVYSGGSIVFDPLGETVLDLGAVECSGIATIELDRVATVRKQLPFQQDADKFTFT